MAQTNTISGASIISDWGIGLYDLSYLVLKHHLVVINPSDIPPATTIVVPRKHRLNSEKLIELVSKDPLGLMDKLLWFPEVKPLLENLSEQKQIRKWRHPSEFERYVLGSSAPDVKEISELHEKQLKSVIEKHESSIRKSPNVFSMLGKVWFVKYNKNEWGLYSDYERYKYIARLLDLSSHRMNKDNWEVSIPNIELYQQVKGKKSKAEIFEDFPHGEDLHVDDRIAETLTKDEINKLKSDINSLLSKLNNARDAGNDVFIQELSDELEEYKKFLIKEYGVRVNIIQGNVYFKTFKRPTKEYEKIRQIIKNQIKSAINDFKDKMPSLYRHLRNSIRPRIFETLYRPEFPLVWHVSV